MDSKQQDEWKNRLLDEVLHAFAAHADLRDILIFKGARMLNQLLENEGRQSKDLDSNLTIEFTHSIKDMEGRKEYLEQNVFTALSVYFEKSELVQYEVSSVKVIRKPQGKHPFGWDGFCVHMQIRDLSRPSQRGIPTVEFDVASPEKLGKGAVIDLDLDGCQVKAYSMHRIVGEKLRAFLSCLPEYQQKIGRRADTRRVRDIFDIARVARCKPVADDSFWTKVANEFRLACESRYVDCKGLETFSQDRELTRRLYMQDATLPSDIPFEEGWECLSQILAFFDELGVLPIENELPPNVLNR